MAESSQVQGPAPMEGHGAYNRSSRVQATGSSPAVPLLEKAAREVELPLPPETVVIADYGSSEGRNSLGPMAAAIRVLRDRLGPDRAVSVVHTDLPGNDFTALFQILASDPDSYSRADPTVFPCAVGRSFYEQILPSSSVTLGWSSWAVQWLSRIPGVIPDQVQIAYSQDAAVRAAFCQQAADDWRCFLVHRAAELSPGGRLVVLSMALDHHGDFGYRPAVAAIYGAVLDLVDEVFISKEEARRMVIPTVGRSRQDFMAPFVGSGSFAGLTLEEIDVFYGEDRIWTEFRSHGDARKYAARWAAFSRASVCPTLAASLDDHEGRAAEFIDRMEARMIGRLKVAPEPMLIPLAKMVLVKGSSQSSA
ncbi:MAG: SAM-dependent methyltransferase [Verrucomicrobia bacterium]|nr:SAM-dependent methyltransferase [Verrucomicrobiota bacterium]